MAPQGHGAGATSQEGACENSNLERQGCNPFYQELIENAYVDPVSSSFNSLLFSCFYITLLYVTPSSSTSAKMSDKVYDFKVFIYIFLL